MGFEPAIPARERPQTRVLDGAATGIGQQHDCTSNMRKTISLTLLKPSVINFEIQKNSTPYTQYVIPNYNQQEATFLDLLFLQTLYMFQAVPPPIIRSTELYVHLQVLSTNTVAASSSIG